MDIRTIFHALPRQPFLPPTSAKLGNLRRGNPISDSRQNAAPRGTEKGHVATYSSSAQKFDVRGLRPRPAFFLKIPDPGQSSSGEFGEECYRAEISMRKPFLTLDTSVGRSEFYAIPSRPADFAAPVIFGILHHIHIPPIALLREDQHPFPTRTVIVRFAKFDFGVSAALPSHQ